MPKKKRYLYNVPPRDATRNYYDYLEDVARQNWREWGYPSEDLAYLNVLNDNTYNYKEYYDNTPPSQRVVNSNTHWPDTYKTVYHPTFSTESRYSGNKSQYNPNGLIGGRWIGGDIFLPTPWQLNDRTRLRYRNGGSIHIKPENRGNNPTPSYEWTRVRRGNGYGYVKTQNGRAVEYDSYGRFKVYDNKNDKSHSYWTTHEEEQTPLAKNNEFDIPLVGNLPEVIIRPQGNTLDHVKEMLPVDYIRKDAYNDTDTLSNISQRESLNRLYNIWLASDKPSISTNGSFLVNDLLALFGKKNKHRPSYNPLTNNIHIPSTANPFDSFISELSHAYQYKSNNNVINKYNLASIGLPGDIKIGGQDGYHRFGNYENSAHYIIEPAILNNIRGISDNLSNDIGVLYNKKKEYALADKRRREKIANIKRSHIYGNVNMSVNPFAIGAYNIYNPYDRPIYRSGGRVDDDEPVVYSLNQLTTTRHRIPSRYPSDVLPNPGQNIRLTSGESGRMVGWAKDDNQPVIVTPNGDYLAFTPQAWLPEVEVKGKRHLPSDGLDKMFVGMMAAPLAAYGLPAFANSAIGAAVMPYLEGAGTLYGMYNAPKHIGETIDNISNGQYWNAIGSGVEAGLDLLGTGYGLKNYGNRVLRRGAEIAMRTSPNANPIPIMKHVAREMLFGHLGGKKRLGSVGSYLLTGKKFGKKGYYNSLAPYPNDYYGGFLTEEGENVGNLGYDYIDALLYGKQIDPRYGLTLVSTGNKNDFGIHTKYIQDLYSNKSNKIPIYQTAPMNNSEITLNDGTVFANTFNKPQSMFDAIPTHNGISADVAGHGKVYINVPNKGLYSQEQDLWKFNSKDYKKRYKGIGKVGNWGLKMVDKLSTPIITRTPFKLDVDAYYRYPELLEQENVAIPMSMFDYDYYRYGGAIHIKPENRGKFTATMKRTGKSAEELSHSSNPLTRKRAIFALNARKWHH